MDITKELIAQAPWAAALLTLVTIFVRYLTRRDKAHNETIERIVTAHDKRVSVMVQDFKENGSHFCNVQEESLKATEKNSVLLVDMRTACVELNKSIATCRQTQALWKEALTQSKGQ